MIQINMEIPNSCADCPMCHPKGKDEPWNYCCFATMDDINIEEWNEERYITCPLKEVPTGKWIHHEMKEFVCCEHWECSNCHKGTMTNPMVKDNDYNHMYYCPKCGAKMESEDNNGSNN